MTSVQAPQVPASSDRLSTEEIASRQDRVDQLIRAYRVRGHMLARIDPLGQPQALQPELEPAYYGFADDDLERKFSARTLGGDEPLTLREILRRLRAAYCESVGVQFMHIDDLPVRHWLQQRLEGPTHGVRLSRSEQVRILTLLTEAVVFEEFVQKKYVGAKTFSLEGCESLIPMLAMAIERAADHGVDDIVLGMAHRGRLNVLVNIMNKSPREVFREFEDSGTAVTGTRGDVKYHLGYSSDWDCPGGCRVHLSLCFNPSHLEYIGPVVIGRVRARQDRIEDVDRRRVMAVLIHGDASFIGQGVVQETLNLSGLEGYYVGGTLHVVVNNQIGFTTSPAEARTALYATGAAKMLGVPIFHVNGEDPEAVAGVVHVAQDFRARFQRDAVIDLYGYRRHGHNEGDEPAFTHPVLYDFVRRRNSVREAYFQNLVKFRGISRDEADEIARLAREELEKGLAEARQDVDDDDGLLGSRPIKGVWRGYYGAREPDDEPDTAVPSSMLSRVLQRLGELPAEFNLHPRLERFLQARREMGAGVRPIDWSAAEALAWATLSLERHPIRLCGQDSVRGTFSQRHAVLHDVKTGEVYCPLRHLSSNQGTVELVNSPLSEAGVLGFAYGYSLDRPAGLIQWEAQFGDFVNAAQVHVDQFLASGEEKWGLLSGLVLLLPHGFEGQGPEHSSARIERFLQLAAGDNIQIAIPTTAAQYFHLLRRQVRRLWRKPLVIMTPKSLLRDPRTASPIDELSAKRFRRVIPDDLPSNGIRRILLCSGKIYYDLRAARERSGRKDAAVVRIEQLYPLKDEHLAEALSPYRRGTPVFWVQEEPENMGAQCYWHSRFERDLLGSFPLGYLARSPSASPAAGSAARHKAEQTALVQRALEG